jgi:Icc-related predicted phosphoesterase
VLVGVVVPGGGALWCVVGLVLASGSLYWLLPADGPPLASAAAIGPSASAAAPASTQPVNLRLDNTLRVLHAPVRLLAFSDLHRDVGRARELVAMSAEADVVIGAGDFASLRLGLRGIIDALSSIGKPVILIPGNNERETALWRAASVFDDARVLHGSGASIGGQEFFGLGYGVPPTPFPWSVDLREERAAEALAPCPDGAILIVHSPPHGHVDTAFGRHLGSHAILDAVVSRHPPLVICGHIHQCWGQESRVGDSLIVNVGPRGRLFSI